MPGQRRNVQDRAAARPDADRVQTETTSDLASPPWSRPKLAVVVRDDLAAWQKLNVTAFVLSGIGVRHPYLVGRPYADADGTRYLAMLGHPVAVLVADADGLRRAFRRALDRELSVAVYTDELFSTGNDEDNRAAVAAVRTEQLALAGFGVAGDRRVVDKALDRLRLHP
jgi:hypothetical protein